MILFLSFSVLILFLYLFLILSYNLGFKNYPSFITNNSSISITVTILIPCRNPKDNLNSLLYKLEQQTNGYAQIIVIDDFSDSIISIPESNHVKLVKLKDKFTTLNPHKNNKKEAITYGVELAQNEYIICLDSDIIISENWWRTISNFIANKNPKFAAGLHRYADSVSKLGQFLKLEQDILTASSIAALQLRFPTMCNGANMVFSKSAFLNVNGYEGLFHTNGGDDLFLYHRIYKRFPFDTHYIKCTEASVMSEAPKTLSELLKQRSRWISKTNHYENKWINIQAGVILLSNIICVLSLCIAALLPMFFLKIVVDIYFIYSIKSFYLLNNRLNLQDCIFFSMIYPFYVAVIGVYALLNSAIKQRLTY